MLLAFKRAARIFRELGLDRDEASCTRTAKALEKALPSHHDSKPVANLSCLAAPGLAAADCQRVLLDQPLRDFSPFFGYYILQARAGLGDVAGCLDSIRQLWGGMLDLGATTFWEHFDMAWLENAARIDEITPPGRTDVHKTCGEGGYAGLRNSLCHGWSAGPTAGSANMFSALFRPARDSVPFELPQGVVLEAA